MRLDRFDAFTHKPTSQYSLAYEKASIIFNISAVLSCHAAHQNRFDDTGLKTAYHSFQASAGMFTYINENFLHAPSTDLSRDTVQTLISIMLAQGQEVFLENRSLIRRRPDYFQNLPAKLRTCMHRPRKGFRKTLHGRCLTSHGSKLCRSRHITCRPLLNIIKL